MHNMMGFFSTDTSNDEMSSAEREAVTRIAERILQSGLVTPAVFFLELMKPFSLLASHTLVFFGPIISAFLQQDKYYRATELLEEPRNVEYLISEIERLDREQHPEAHSKGGKP